MTNSSPIIILVAPQMGENIGAAVRGMLNFGLKNLRIVAPRDGWPNQAAIDMAAGAFDVVEAGIFATLKDALADCQYAYGTTVRPRDQVKPVFTGRGAAEDAHQRSAASQKIAFVFGRERTGLENDEVALCHGIITIPTNPDFSSLNLGQAVMLMAYEWMGAQDQTPPRILQAGESAPASHEKMDEFIVRLEQELDAGGFFKSAEKKPTVMRNIRAMFTRGDLTDQEVRTLHGMISALKNKT